MTTVSRQGQHELLGIINKLSENTNSGEGPWQYLKPKWKRREQNENIGDHSGVRWRGADE